MGKFTWLAAPLQRWEWPLYSLLLLILSLLAPKLILLFGWLMLLRSFLARRANELLSAPAPAAYLRGSLGGLSLLYWGLAASGWLLQGQLTFSSPLLLLCVLGLVFSLLKLLGGSYRGK